MIIALLATASAADVSTAVTDMITSINAEFGSPVIHPGAHRRLRPATLEAKITTLVTRLEAHGCTASLDVQETLAGTYGAGTIVGATSSGDVDLSFGAGRSIGGTQDGLADMGVGFSTYNKQGRFVADREDGGFVVGHFIRIQGASGVFVGIEGTCDAGGTPLDALRPLFGGDLSDWTSSGLLSLSDFNTGGAPSAMANPVVTLGSTAIEVEDAISVDHHLWSRFELLLTADGYRPHRYYGVNDGDLGYALTWNLVDEATLGGLSAVLGIPLDPTRSLVQVRVYDSTVNPLTELAGVEVNLDQPYDVALSRVAGPGLFAVSNVTDDSLLSLVTFVNVGTGPLTPSVVAPPGYDCTVAPGVAPAITGVSAANEMSQYTFICAPVAD